MNLFHVSLNVNSNRPVQDIVKIYSLPYALKESNNFKYWRNKNIKSNFYPLLYFQMVMFLCHQMLKWGFLDHWSIIHTQQSGNVTQSESFRKKKKSVIKEYYSTVMCLLSSGISPFSLLRGTIADVNLNAVANLNKTFRRQVGISKKKCAKSTQVLSLSGFNFMLCLHSKFSSAVYDLGNL